jgi:hypothetical protein
VDQAVREGLVEESSIGCCRDRRHRQHGVLSSGRVAPGATGRESEGLVNEGYRVTEGAMGTQTATLPYQCVRLGCTRVERDIWAGGARASTAARIVSELMVLRAALLLDTGHHESRCGVVALWRVHLPRE